MRVCISIDELAELSGPVVLALGVFDGLHIGHQAVLEAARGLARETDATAVASTFHPHPRRLLAPDNAPLLLTSLPHQKRLLARMGFDHLLVIPFTADLAAKPAPEFVGLLAAPENKLAGIVTGADFCFGRARSGTADTLAGEGAARGFRTVAVPPVLLDGERVSSTLVRRNLREGNLAKCARLLGRPFSVLGTVVEGRQLGRTLGFPTANVRVPNEQLPPAGVYAVRADLDGRLLPGVANLGHRPTLGDECGLSLEVHLFDFNESIYGAEIEVSFEAFIRPEQRFSGLDALEEAIAVDVAEARALLCW
jgi:riboflavin kinase/FMN adenylyltransferase